MPIAPLAIDETSMVEQVALCFYIDGWNGPGFYNCGYRYRRGFGWHGSSRGHVHHHHHHRRGGIHHRGGGGRHVHGGGGGGRHMHGGGGGRRDGGGGGHRGGGGKGKGGRH
jgi:hypothetical protein